MSLIDFQSNTELRKKREWEREVRETILTKVKGKYDKIKHKEDEAKRSGEHSWMLPSVEEKIESSKKLSKSKKKKKKHKHKKKSSSESESEEENLVWVEKASQVKPQENEEKKDGKSEGGDQESSQREEWMEMKSLFQTYSRQELAHKEGSSRKLQKAEESKKIEEVKLEKAKARELNPFYKHGGSGLPAAEAPKQSSPIGLSSGWLRKALKRAQNQAEEDGKTLEEIAAQRWGSLKKFYDLLHDAEASEGIHANDKQEKTFRCKYKEKERGRHLRDRSRSRSREGYRKPYRSSRQDESRQKRSHSRSPDILLKSYEAQKPGFKDFHNSSLMKFKSPEEDRISEVPRSGLKDYKASGRWKKKDISGESLQPPFKEGPKSIDSDPPEPGEEQNSPKVKSKDTKETPKFLSDKEMNKLAAKALKAELSGNDDLAEKLRAKLEKAREVRSSNLNDNPTLDDTKPQEEVIILTKVDSKGFAMPIASKEDSSRRGKKKGHGKMASHGADGKRSLYFADDDKYNLKTMFEKEKGTSAEEQNSLFEEAALRNKEKLDDDFDVDDMFLSKDALKDDSARQEEREKQRAIKAHQNRQKTLDSCPWCFENKDMAKNLIVSLGTKCYVCLPPHESLTRGHCMIVPIHHITCSTQADEDLWEEIMVFRKSLVRFFNSCEEDCIFFEMATRLRHFPHMVIYCIPLERTVGELAPIYFKKALDDCDEEWAQNKRVVDLKGRDVRKAIPKGLPYFFVDFGLSPGFAHVIESEHLFKQYFAQEIVGGMIDADPSLWRKPTRENFDAQRRKVMEFANKYKEYDPNL